MEANSNHDSSGQRASDGRICYQCSDLLCLVHSGLLVGKTRRPRALGLVTWSLGPSTRFLLMIPSIMTPPGSSPVSLCARGQKDVHPDHIYFYVFKERLPTLCIRLILHASNYTHNWLIVSAISQLQAQLATCPII